MHTITVINVLICSENRAVFFCKKDDKLYGSRSTGIIVQRESCNIHENRVTVSQFLTNITSEATVVYMMLGGFV